MALQQSFTCSGQKAAFERGRHIVERTGQDRTGQEQRNELTNESGLSGAKHSDGTVFVVIPVSSTSSGEAGRHVEVGANESAYATTGEFYRLMMPWQRGVNQDTRGICY